MLLSKMKDFHADSINLNAEKKINTYVRISAIIHGTVLYLPLFACITFSTMTPIVLNVDQFGGYITLALYVGIVFTGCILFFVNPLIPFIIPIISFFQSILFALLLVCITVCKGYSGMIIYLVVNFLIGIANGVTDLVSFTLFTFSPGNNLPFLCFGLTLGGGISFVLSIISKDVIFPSNSVHDVYNSMVVIIATVIACNMINMVNMIFYIRNDSIKSCLNKYKVCDMPSQGGNIRHCMTGFKYCWKLLLTDLIALCIMLTVYPGIAPGLWKMTVNEKVQVVGTMQVSMTISRGYATFIKEKYQIHSLRIIFIALACDIPIMIYFVLLCGGVFDGSAFFNNHILKLFLSFVFISVTSYSLTFTIKLLKNTLPSHLNKSVIISTVAAYGISKNIFRLVGCGISQLLISFALSSKIK